MSSIVLNIWDDLIRILQGSIPSGANQTISFYGLPPIILAIIPFVIGIVLGIQVKRALKLVLGLVLIAAVALYFGVISWGTLNNYLQTIYSAIPLAIHYAALLFVFLPLGLGLLIGFIIGLLFR